MGARPRPIDPPARVVLDTAVVVSALVFEAGRLAWLRSAWPQERIRPLMSKPIVKPAELRTVLGLAESLLGRQFVGTNLSAIVGNLTASPGSETIPHGL